MGSGKHRENARLVAAPFLPAVPKYAQRSSPLKAKALLLPRPAGRVVLQRLCKLSLYLPGSPEHLQGLTRG